MDIKSLIEKYDSQNQFQVLIDSYKQIDHSWNNHIEGRNDLSTGVNNIVIAGMGGSAISVSLLNCFLSEELNVPLILASDYSLPAFANEDTLVIISSYSGNTEESVSCLQDAIKKNCKIIILSTGGSVQEIANEHNLFWIKLADGFQPRFALGTSFFSLLKLLQSIGFIPDQNKFVSDILELWKKKGIEYSQGGNEALKYAESLVGFIPVIYSSVKFESIGYRLKCQFNENSKLLAFNNVYPELNHNEIVGWETFSDKVLNAKLISIVDRDYHPQILKRIGITNEILSRIGTEIITLKSNEENIKVRIMDLIYLGDWITFYLSILRGYDPSEIDNITEMKRRLS